MQHRQCGCGIQRPGEVAIAGAITVQFAWCRAFEEDLANIKRVNAIATDKRSAATPVTTAVAKLVPLAELTLPPGTATGRLSPGASSAFWRYGSAQLLTSNG
jgi:hypothetical protein